MDIIIFFTNRGATLAPYSQKGGQWLNNNLAHLPTDDTAARYRADSRDLAKLERSNLHIVKSTRNPMSSSTTITTHKPDNHGRGSLDIN